jgi:ribonucleotide reductase beta subunit family protein with ferritin-like domain
MELKDIKDINKKNINKFNLINSKKIFEPLLFYNAFYFFSILLKQKRSS